MISNIRHAGIVVHDVAQAIDFYCTELGFKFKSSGKLLANDVVDLYGDIGVNAISWYKLEAPLGTTLLELYYAPGLGVLSNLLAHVSVTVENIHELFDRLPGVISNKVVCMDKHLLFFARDPSGNLIELVEPPK
jgi:catechol 2,3-dioxygenase-like lactoylglutathione lyase family enzyme